MGRKKKFAVSADNTLPTPEEILETGKPEQDLNSLKNEFTEVKEKTTRKPRVKKIDPETEQQANSFGLMFSSVMDMVVSRLPKPIPLSETEKMLLNQSATALTKKHAEKILMFGEEIGFAVTLFLVLQPRLKSEKKSEEIINEKIN